MLGLGPQALEEPCHRGGLGSGGRIGGPALLHQRHKLRDGLHHLGRCPRPVAVLERRLQTTTATTGETSFGGGGGGGEVGQDQSVAFQATMTKGVGTPLWMAPELFVGGTKYGAEVDLYSFGVIMWELLTRKVPWEEAIDTTQYILFFAALCTALENGDRPLIPAEVAEAAPEFVALMEECWATDPAARPEAAAVVRHLEGLRAEA